MSFGLVHRQVLHDNADQLPVDEVSSLVLFLLGLVTHPATSLRGQHNGSGSRAIASGWSRNVDDDMEVQRLAFVAIGNVYTRAEPVISNETWKLTVQVRHVIRQGILYLVKV